MRDLQGIVIGLTRATLVESNDNGSDCVLWDMETISPSKQDDILPHTHETIDDANIATSDSSDNDDDAPATPVIDIRNGEARTPASRISDLSRAISSIVTPGTSSKHLIQETMQEFGNVILQRKHELSAMRKSGGKGDSEEKQVVESLSACCVDMCARACRC